MRQDTVEVSSDAAAAPIVSPKRVLIALGPLLFAVVVVRTAWVSEDAYITFRTLDNLVNGHGLRWNPAERVQAYTHPLWLLLLIPFYAVTHEIFYTSLLVSLTLSLAALLIITTRVARSAASIAVAVAVAVSSHAFVDYATSGLENPLTYLLLSLFWATYLEQRRDTRRLAELAVIGGLVVLTRTDSIGLIAPALVVRARQCGLHPRTAAALALGAVPHLLWTGFSVFYYGFPWPNTAYAKLGTGIPRAELAEQGVFYLFNSLSTDPVTMLVIVAAMTLGLLTAGRTAWPVVAGIALQLGYVVTVGGDFMSGRFLTGCLVTALLLLVQLDLPIGPALVLAAGVVILGLMSPDAPLRSNASYGENVGRLLDQNGIADERGVYYPSSGLLRAARAAPLRPSHPWALNGLQARSGPDHVVAVHSVGYFGYFAGPGVHIVDRYALADPLLARLPAAREAGWRIGHFERTLPPGYLETLTSGQNQIRDPSLATYYDHLARITRGPLLSRNRLLTIWRINTGQYDHLLPHDRPRP